MLLGKQKITDHEYSKRWVDERQGKTEKLTAQTDWNTPPTET